MPLPILVLLSAFVGLMLPDYCQASPHSNPLPGQANSNAIIAASFIFLVILICIGFLVFKMTRNGMRFFERLNEIPPHPNQRPNEIALHPNQRPNEVPLHGPNERPDRLSPHPNKGPLGPNEIPAEDGGQANDGIPMIRRNQTQTSTGVRKRNHWDGGSQQVSEDTHRSHFPESSEFVVHHSRLPSKEHYTGTLGQSDCHPFLANAVWDLQLLDFEKSYETSSSSPPDQSSKKQSMRDQLQLFSCEYEDEWITGSPICAKQCNPPTSCYNRSK